MRHSLLRRQSQRCENSGAGHPRDSVLFDIKGRTNKDFTASVPRNCERSCPCEASCKSTKNLGGGYIQALDGNKRREGCSKASRDARKFC